jgi:two-component system, sensor histidine kinase ChiS
MSFRTLSIFLAVYVATMATVLAVPSQTLPQCAAPETSRVLRDPAVCMHRSGIDSQGSTIEATMQSLFKSASERLAAGRFDEAERTLDCADASLGANGDIALRYELIRQRGILDYRRERIPQALSRFECALKMSNAREDRVATARDMKNVGTALRRLGDFRGALRTLVLSLEMQRANGHASGAVLINIADVYRELEEYDESMRYYREAMQAFRDEGERTEAAHVLESMAETELDRGESRRAETLLREALAVYRHVGNRTYELRVHDGLTRAALAQGDLAGARTWAASALAIATEHKMPIGSELRLQIARTKRMSGRPEAARAQLNAALASVPEGEGTRAALLEELAALQESAGDTAALQTLRRAHAEAMERAHAQHDRQLGWMRTRFETAERDRTINTLETQNRLSTAEVRQRTLWLWLIATTMLAGVLSFWLWWQRRRNLERMRQEARRVQYEEELARYRREADALAEDRNLLQMLLDSREDPVCLLDAEGIVLAANRAASGLLSVADGTPVGRMITETLSDADARIVAAALEGMEDSAEQRIEIASRNGAPLLAWLSPWAGGDGLIVLALHTPTESVVADTSASKASAIQNDQVEIPSTQTSNPPSIWDDAASNTTVSPRNDTDEVRDEAIETGIRDQFRRMLVELMLATLDAWERATGSSRLELAEKSRIWRVNIDDGRLRARAMERYLGVAKLPQNPRWRDVLRTAYYVLGKCEGLTEPARADLQAKIDAVLAYTRRDALV